MVPWCRSMVEHEMEGSGQGEVHDWLMVPPAPPTFGVRLPGWTACTLRPEVGCALDGLHGEDCRPCRAQARRGDG